jgi:4-alpha-glucanotransferase
MLVDHRSSGIICHPTCLPGPYGIGDLGPQARRFVDFLQRTGQTLWQVLPLGPTGYGDSPYMCLSAFGGNPLLISPEGLTRDGLLQFSEIANPPVFNRKRVQYGRVQDYKLSLLERACERFGDRADGTLHDDFQDFCEKNTTWLEEYALFKALKEAHQQRVWSQWEPGAAHRDPDALAQWREDLRDRIAFQRFLQWAFFRQWAALKQYAAERGIQIVGDIPIYVAYDSADVWANQHLFRLDAEGVPEVVAGVPPDYFSTTGQRWGNPIYRWGEVRREGYRWWIERFRAEFAKCDILRVDHFRGFEAFWEIPAEEPTAVHGRWVKGPGADLFLAVRSALAGEGVALRIIAEDLGVITSQVDALRDELGFPGMRVLQMAFGKEPKAADYRPHNHAPNSVVYTATHDHNTTMGWFTADPGSQSTQTFEEIQAERDLVRRYVGTDGREIHWDFIRLALGSVSWMAIFPLQDVLGLGGEARMNMPGQGGGNWEWRFTFDMLTQDIRGRLADMTDTYERSPASVQSARTRGALPEIMPAAVGS